MFRVAKKTGTAGKKLVKFALPAFVGVVEKDIEFAVKRTGEKRLSVVVVGYVVCGITDSFLKN